MPRFIGQEVEVRAEGEVREPVSFQFEGREHRIAEVLERWHDRSYGGDSSRKGRWWQRRHRTCYQVRTESGDIFELHHERGTHLETAQKGKWFLYRQL
ncbi:MAG: hypothetical protein HY676_04250 [Chloroflexi bacterium]|nr:hypothetical protein [Chloroflexota bacterium]